MPFASKLKNGKRQEISMTDTQNSRKRLMKIINMAQQVPDLYMEFKALVEK